MKQLFYLPVWFLKAKFLGRKSPLQTVLFISEKCNLSCKHCSVYNHTNPATKSYDEIRSELEYSYRLGSRFVDFEGGEPFIWRDGARTVNDLCDLAKEMGFFSTTITTNAQLPFSNSHADSIWVSLDGIGQAHDAVRGKGTFKRLVDNITSCGHKALSVNMVVNKLNHHTVVETIEFAQSNPHIQSISINFHTPYEGTESLYLTPEEKGPIIDRIIDLRKKGYPIMNSVSGLKLMKRNDFEKECWVANFILSDGTKLRECAGKTAGVCDRCGFGMAGEMKSLFALKPDTIFAGMKLRMRG